MKKVRLYGKYGIGKYALVSDSDYGKISSYKWFVNDQGYVLTAIGKKNHRIHRVILGYSGLLDIDHINRNKLDNRRSNLRIVDRSTNNYNMPLKKNNTSGYKGVSWFKPAKLWRAYIGGGKNRLELGYFKSKSEAIKARKQAEVSL